MGFLLIYALAGALAVALTAWVDFDEPDDIGFWVFLFCCNPIFYAMLADIVLKKITRKP